MDSLSINLIPGIAGGVLGIMGGIVGTSVSIFRARGKAAKVFMIKYSVLGWLLMACFIAAIILLPSPWNHLTWIPLAFAMSRGIHYINTRLPELELKGSEV